jgi:hypothetical protein
MLQEHLSEKAQYERKEGLSSTQIKSLVFTSVPVLSLRSAEEQKYPFSLTPVADTSPKFVAHVGRHMREVAIAAIPFSAYDDSDKSSETEPGDRSGMDDSGNEIDEYEGDGLSQLISDWKNASTLQSSMEPTLYTNPKDVA